MRSIVLLLALLFATTSIAEGQILAVHFKDAKAEKKFKKYTMDWNGNKVLLGEAVPGGGIRIEHKRGEIENISYKSGSDNDFFIFDTKNPENVPYRIKDGEPVAKSKKSIVTVHGKYIDRLQVFNRGETIETIAREYRLRKGRVEESRASRDEHPKGSPEWFAAHQRMLNDYERLVSWLKKSSFVEAAKGLEKEFKKEAKAIAKEAIAERAKRAQESVRIVDTPQDLLAASLNVGGEPGLHKMAESQHIRIVYHTGWGEHPGYSDSRIKEALVLGEQVIEAFRVQYVDPYVGEDFKDQIPDGLFHEIYWGPDDVSFYEKFVPEYFGVSWGDEKNKKRRLEAGGNWFFRGTDPKALLARRTVVDSDLDGDITHTLGHSLAHYHYNGSPSGFEQAWLEEGLGYYLAFEFLGRNSVSCFEFRDGLYTEEENQKGRRAKAEMGYRDKLNAAALDGGPRIDRLMIKYLADFENPDVAKSWSFFDYMARSHDKTGQRWLRASSEFARKRNTFIADLRKFSEELFGVAGEDVYQVLDDRWRAYAESEQDTTF